MVDFERARARMVEEQLVGRGVTDRRVIDAMRAVPRERFVDDECKEFAYADSPLPISEGQTISQPFIVALMAEAAEVDTGDRVLEIGTGSGYAAAVLAKVAGQVLSIERHAALADVAKARLHALGIRNVEVRTGDGTKGWPDQGRFDAILVAAGASSVPAALKEQLEIGARLVIPVGPEHQSQRLLRITRLGEDTFEEEDLGGVAFVPLVGEQASDDDLGPATPRQTLLPDMVAAAAEGFSGPDAPDLAALFDRFGGRKVVLLDESSHGTSEFYRARAAITRHLIEEHGFTLVAVEADWPDAASVNRHVLGRPPLDEDAPFRRLPAWMWRNTDVAEFLRWLRNRNDAVPPARRAGFYGLDMYNMRDAIASVLAYLDQVDPEAAKVARQRYGCLTPWQNEPATYGPAVLTSGYRLCEEPVARQCRDLLEKRVDYATRDGEAFLDAAQNARLIASAERYYRVMYYGGPQSWNLRDRHMFETLQQLLNAKGPDAKAVVWAHNSHIGDARHTGMGQDRHELNIGQLCREHFGGQAALIGFGTDSGTVAAASDWDGEMEVKTVKPAHPDSVERSLHLSGRGTFLLDFSRHPELAEALAAPRLQRFIGVIYRPETELASHYVEASLSKQFDAFVWFDKTSAVNALPGPREDGGVPDTFPHGL